MRPPSAVQPVENVGCRDGRPRRGASPTRASALPVRAVVPVTYSNGG